MVVIKCVFPNEFMWRNYQQSAEDEIYSSPVTDVAVSSWKSEWLNANHLDGLVAILIVAAPVQNCFIYLSQCPVYKHGLTLMPAWISNPKCSKAYDEHYFSIPKLQGLHRWSLTVGKWFHPALNNGCNFSSMLGLKVIHVREKGNW